MAYLKRIIGISISTILAFAGITWLTATTWDTDRSFSYGYPLTFHEKFRNDDYAFSPIQSSPGNFILDLLFSLIVGIIIWKIITLANETRKKSTSRFVIYLVTPIIIFLFSFGGSYGFNAMTDRLDRFSFLSGAYLSIAIILLNFEYFAKHYVKAILLFMVITFCHAFAIFAELISNGFFIQYQSGMGMTSGNDWSEETLQLAGYLLSNLISTSILLLFLSFIFAFKKWHRLIIFFGSFVSTYLMYYLILHLTRTLPHPIESEVTQMIFVFAFWQCITGTIISIALNEGSLLSEEQKIIPEIEK